MSRTRTRADRRTDRRGFLAGAGKCGALLIGAALVPAASAEPGAAQGLTPASGEIPVEEKGIVRLLGVTQRRPGLTRLQVKFRSPDYDFSAADKALVEGVATTIAPRQGAKVAAEERRPTQIAIYYRWVYADLTKNDPGPQQQQTHNVVVDGAFGDGQTCTAFGNRDLVTELFYQRENAKPATARPEPTPPDVLEASSALNLVVQQVVAQGHRPADAFAAERVMHFLKLSGGAATDAVQAWQRVHDRAIAATPGFGAGLMGYELLQRLPNTLSREPLRCAGGDVPVPEAVASFWPKKGDGGASWQNYVRAFRQADTEKVFDPAACFFLVIEEYRYT